jgi:hypothetical protein
MKEVISKHSVTITIGTMIAVLLFIISTTMSVATWKAEMDAQHQEFDDRISHVGDKVVGMRSDIAALEARAANRDIELATINTKLASIEALVLDIRVDLKEVLKNDREQT